MTKEYQKKCPNCCGTNLGALFDGQGNGLCSHCRGEGIIYGLEDAIPSILVGSKNYHTCEICYGTGQCQTCGGTGYIFYDEDEYLSENDQTNNDTYYDDNYSYSSDYHSGSSNGDTLAIQIILIIAAVWILFALFNTLRIINTNNSRNPTTKHDFNSSTHDDSQLRNNSEADKIIVNECETNNTGEYSFRNTTSRVIYIYLHAYTRVIKIEVEPNQSFTETNLTAGKYRYKYSYYKSSNYTANDVKGEIIVGKCTNTEMELKLPEAYWYNLTSNEWTEVKVPTDGLYFVVIPYKNFLIRFSESDKFSYGNSYGPIPEGVSRIYLKNQYDKDLEVSIQKYSSR